MRSNMEEKKTVPLVSVIMPAYNAERFIAEAIDSVLNQTVKNIELIVVDDCSSDGTCRIVEEYTQKDSRVKLLRNEHNLQVAQTRNRGLEICRGEYVALLDSDDLWYPTKLEKQINAAGIENADIVYCSYAIVDEAGESACADFIVPPTTDFEKTLSKSVISCSTVLLTAATIREEKFVPGFYHEDLLYWLRLLQNGKKAVGITEVLAEYRVYSGTKTFNKLNSAKFRWQVYRKGLKFGRWKSACYFVKYALNGIMKYRGMNHQ